MEVKKEYQAVFITIIFILSSLQSAYAVGENFTYDANGNMIQGPGGLYYEYNYANQLKRVREGGPTGEVIAEYWYDHTGKRKKKNESGVVTYYWFDDFEQIYYPNGTIVNITYYSANNERLAKKVSTAAGDKMYYFHPDHLGSTSIVSDEDGNLVEKTEYYPYGGVKQGGSEQYLFTGKELDKGTGLYYYGARYYSPELMRFTQPDSIIQDAYDPQTLNRYAYVRNNPLKYTDPTGNVLINKVNFDMTTDPNTGQRIATDVSVTNTPTAQPLSRQEYYAQERSNIKWRWAFARYDTVKIVSGYVGGKAAVKLGKKAEIANDISGMIQKNDEASYLAAVWAASKFMNDDEFEKFLKENEDLEYAIKSYPTYRRDFNPHSGSPSYTPYRRSGGGCNYCNTPGYEGYWAPPSWVDDGYDPETGTWPD